MKKLSSEVISLIHHVKLNDSGWWEKAIRKIIKSIYGLNNNSPLQYLDVNKSIKELLGGNISHSKLKKEFEFLISEKELVNFSDDYFILSEESFNEYKLLSANQFEIERKARERFLNILGKEVPELEGEKVWKEFNEKLLLPLIKESGARTFEIISGKQTFNIEDSRQLHEFIKVYSSKQGLIRVITKFLDFQTEPVRQFILRQLIGYFFVEATNLDDRTVKRVYSLSKSQTKLKVYVDTNFLLTLLDLHDNPSNEATFSLLELLSEIKNRVDVKFYVFPITISEFQNLIGRFRDYLMKTRPTIEYAKAIQTNEELSGILKKYFQKCIDTKTVINPRDYFNPYLQNFTVLLRRKGIELQNESLEKYSNDQRVIDDLHEQVEFRINKVKKDRAFRSMTNEERELEKEKTWDKFKHDCRLWYAVYDKRPGYIDSPKDVKNWIITLDFNFIYFDRYKQKIGKGSEVSICIHPNELISMLQFWVPRTESFEKAIFGNFRLPFLFKEFDVEAEKVSLEILKALSVYEESKELSDDLISEILTNNALRQKIKPSQTVEENAELLKEEVFKKYEKTREELREEKTFSKELQSELKSVKQEVTSLSRKVEELNEAKLKEIEKKLAQIHQIKINEFESRVENKKLRINQLEERLSDFKEIERRAKNEYERVSNSFSFQFKSFFFRGNELRKELRDEIHAKFYEKDKVDRIRTELDSLKKEVESFTPPVNGEKLIYVCENQNASIFNKLGFENIRFIPERDSAGVFFKVLANQHMFGIRDRDFLMDAEIYALREKYSNYRILDYYCFENYLYHPKNIEQIQVSIRIEDYVEEILRQRDKNRDKIISRLEMSRKSYQEFKANDQGVKMIKDLKPIIEDLDSDSIDRVLKVFSLKDKYFDKSFLKKENLTTERLISTDWFRDQILQILIPE